MREVTLKNSRLQGILSSISDVVFDDKNLSKLSQRQIHKGDDLIQDLHPASDEYFTKARQLPIQDYNYPRSSLGTQTHAYERGGSGFFHELVSKQLMKLQNTLGCQSNALCMLYPDDGYIGWHHNGNAPGYNVLFSYSQDGDGYFKYYDKEKDKIIYMQDNPGWNVKCGYYPDERREPDRVYWHAAATKKARLSVAFIINNRDMWINMIEYITDGDFDRHYLEGQGPLGDLKNAGYIE